MQQCTLARVSEFFRSCLDNNAFKNPEIERQAGGRENAIFTWDTSVNDRSKRISAKYDIFLIAAASQNILHYCKQTKGINFPFNLCGMFLWFLAWKS